MGPATRERLLADGVRASNRRAADVDAALADGMRRYRRRVVRTYAAAALTVVFVAMAALGIGLVSGATVGSGSAAPGSSTAIPTSPTPTTPTMPTTRTYTPTPGTHTSTPSTRSAIPSTRSAIPSTRSAGPSTAPPSTPPALAMSRPVLKLVVGETVDAQVVDLSTGTPTPVPADELSWTSLDASVATVSDKGVVTGIHEGTTTVTASMGGSTATAGVEVSVPIR